MIRLSMVSGISSVLLGRDATLQLQPAVSAYHSLRKLLICWVQLHGYRERADISMKPLRLAGDE